MLIDHVSLNEASQRNYGGNGGIFFSTGATTHCGFVFCNPLAGL